MNPFIGILLDAAVKAGAKFARLKAARKLIDSVKKKGTATAVAAVLVVGSPGCALVNNLDDCSKLRLAEQLACPVDPESKECKEARELLAAKCGWVPPPVVPPVTPPVDPPVTPPVDPPVDPPITPPPATGCTLAGEPTVFVSTPNTLGEVVNLAMHNLRPDCEIGGLCLLGDMRQQEWQAAVEAELRRLGFCAGQHSPGTDEIAVAAKPDDLWQGFHVFAGDDSSRATFVRRTVKWSPQAYTGAWRSPNLNPPVDPPKPAGPCPSDPQPLLSYPDGKPHWKMNLAPNRDPTPTYIDTWDGEKCPYCTAIGMRTMNGQPRCGCPFRQEGLPDRQVCEETAIGLPGPPSAPFWEVWNGTLNVEVGWRGSCSGTGCQVRACNRDRTVCSEWK